MSCCRFLNSRAAKAMFRADQIDGAERTAALFTKEGDQANNLHEMQCMWYEIEGGEAHLRQRQYGKVSRQQLPADWCDATGCTDQKLQLMWQRVRPTCGGGSSV